MIILYLDESSIFIDMSVIFNHFGEYELKRCVNRFSFLGELSSKFLQTVSAPVTRALFYELSSCVVAFILKTYLLGQMTYICGEYAK